MFGSFLEHYRPCPDCGAYVPLAQEGDHECAEDRRVDYQVALLRGEIARFEEQLADFLCTPIGRFELYYAARQRLLRVA